MDKLTMAQDYIIAEVRRVGICSIDEDKIMDAWKVADAMQAEAEKRNKAEAEQKRKEIREMLNAPNTFIEREGRHFDDVEEWQPDWSQAPETAIAWKMQSKSSAAWIHNKRLSAFECSIAPTFNYQGDWKDSLRERPEALCKVDWSVAPQDATGWKMKEDRAYWIGSDGWIIKGAPSFGFTGSHIMERPNGF